MNIIIFDSITSHQIINTPLYNVTALFCNSHKYMTDDVTSATYTSKSGEQTGVTKQ